MQEVSKGEGRTVLFVSHNMESIKNLCTCALLLKEGKIINIGHTEKIIDSYITTTSEAVYKYDGDRKWDIDKAPGNDAVRLLGICSKNGKGEITSTFDVSEEIFIEIEFIILKKGFQFYQCLEFTNTSKIYLFRIYDNYINNAWGKQEPLDFGRKKTTYFLPKNLLQEGVISIHINISTPEFPFIFASPIREIEAFYLNIIDSLTDNESARGSYPFNMNGPVFRPLIKSTTECLTM